MMTVKHLALPEIWQKPFIIRTQLAYIRNIFSNSQLDQQKLNLNDFCRNLNEVQAMQLRTYSNVNTSNEHINLLFASKFSANEAEISVFRSSAIFRKYSSKKSTPKSITGTATCSEKKSIRCKMSIQQAEVNKDLHDMATGDWDLKSLIREMHTDVMEAPLDDVLKDDKTCINRHSQDEGIEDHYEVHVVKKKVLVNLL